MGVPPMDRTQDASAKRKVHDLDALNRQIVPADEKD
ncbi:MAG: hypothetical protein JWM21_3064 [Acidobacteria bacterium]|nr:hypothetical protein [Acidobacteriota bacterium]